mmetsp:Transcript_1040/g.2030  ORF Transcript_1040/g.2030 Transcript_1040/m.2030 type:complete len:83 (-) Transcript_1040:2150-2398(-)
MTTKTMIHYTLQLSHSDRTKSCITKSTHNANMLYPSVCVNFHPLHLITSKTINNITINMTTDKNSDSEVTSMNPSSLPIVAQ